MPITPGIIIKHATIGWEDVIGWECEKEAVSELYNDMNDHDAPNSVLHCGYDVLGV